MPIKGEVVLVETRKLSGKNDFGEDIHETNELEVKNVLVCPSQRQDIRDSSRPDGVRLAYTLHFPKGFAMNLKGLRIKVRGEWLNVIGQPTHYTRENTPGWWWMPVEVEAYHG